MNRPASNQDKRAWCEAGAEQEWEFIQSRLFGIGIPGMVNVAKRQDPYTHDLVVQLQADLKSVRTPFFTAGKYGLEPQFAVTFNEKDALRYRDLYPNIVVFFDIDWQQTEYGEISVEPMRATYAGFLGDIRTAIQKSGNHKHAYRERVDDEAGNAKASWVFDVRYLHRVA